MPISARATELLNELLEADPELIFLGLAINPNTGEMGTLSSLPMPPGQILGALQESVVTMLQSMMDGKMEAENGEHHAGGTDAAAAVGGAGTGRIGSRGISLVH